VSCIVFFSVLLGVSTACLYLKVIVKRSRDKESDGCFKDTRRRLEIYAMLMHESEKSIESCPDDIGKEPTGSRSANNLSASAHKILLGVLKKIEAKNSVLLAVVVFWLAAMLRMAGYLIGEDISVLTQVFYFSAVGGLIGVLLSRIDGANHIGFERFRQLSKKYSPEKDAVCAREMQTDLLGNLIEKEAGFSGSTRSIFVVVALLGLAAVFSLDLDPIHQVNNQFDQLIDFSSNRSKETIQ
jgi:hypothetical protein